MPDPNQSMFLRVPLVARPVILDALRAAGMHGAALSVEQFTADYADDVKNEERLRWVEMARRQVQRDGEVEIDNDATISHSSDFGEYVLAWVWVDDDEEKVGDG